jgi:hypothetical protein
MNAGFRDAISNNALTIVFGVVTVEITDAIGRVSVAFPAKIMLDWNLIAVEIVVVVVVVVEGRETKERMRRVKRASTTDIELEWHE